MQIYIIRHAIAELRENWEQPDEERPLTAKGRKKMARIASGLSQIGAEFTHLYASPLVRARQTAEIIQKRFKLKAISQTDLLVPEAAPEHLLPFLNEHEDEAALALVGHEPHASALLTFLLTGSNSVLAYFKKGGVALLEGNKPLHAGRCTLRWLMEPNHLAELGGK
ncbi:phosphohistidine phosphatase SixA [candidate division KSB1 bacterium]|nr:phosphohistidine phosphatase SixA [candidate division KSB1 bacterium]